MKSFKFSVHVMAAVCVVAASTLVGGSRPATATSSIPVSVFNYPGLNGSVGSYACDVENSNLLSIVDNLSGYTVDDDIVSFGGDFATQLDNSRFFFMTDMENQNPSSTSFYPTAARTKLASWVSNGGVLVMTGTYSTYDTTFLNLTFGWDLTTQSASPWAKNTANTAGTPFDSVNVASLTNPSATDSIGKGSVTGFKAMWGTDSNATVAVIPYGSGNVIFMGYDFYNTGKVSTTFRPSQTACAEASNDWVSLVLPAALQYASSLSSATIVNRAATSATLRYSTSETGTMYWMLVPSGSATPTTAQIKAGAAYGGVTPVSNGSQSVTANVSVDVSLSSLSATTEYVAHAYTEYGAGPSATAIQSKTFTTLPRTPVLTSLTVGNQSLEAGFTQATSTVTNYEYRTSTNGGSTYGSWTALSPVDTASPITISSLTNGTAYTVQVRAVNGVDTSEASNALTATPRAVPGAPTGLTVTPLTNKASLSWAAPASTGGSSIVDYVVQWSGDGGSTWTSDGLTSTSTSAEVTGLDSCSPYLFRVAATNATDTGPASSEVAAMVYGATYGATYSAGNFTRGGVATDSAGTITLTPNTGGQFGAIWAKQRLDLASDFCLSAEVNLGSNDAGADGMAFVMQPNSTAAGSSGGGLGYLGITPSFVVEIDTYQNASDLANDHAGLMKDGDTNHGSAHWGESAVDLGNVEDGAWRTLQVLWNATAKRITIGFDKNDDGDVDDSGETLYSAVSADLPAHFTASSGAVYWGFTAATGGATNLQQVRGITYTGTGRTNTAPTFGTTVGTRTLTVSAAAQQVDLDIADDSTTQAQWTIALTSSNSTLFPTANLSASITGAGDASIEFEPATGVSGTATLTVTITDADGVSTTQTFTVNVGVSGSSGGGPAPTTTTTSTTTTTTTTSTTTTTTTVPRTTVPPRRTTTTTTARRTTRTTVAPRLVTTTTVRRPTSVTTTTVRRPTIITTTTARPTIITTTTTAAPVTTTLPLVTTTTSTIPIVLPPPGPSSISPEEMQRLLQQMVSNLQSLEVPVFLNTQIPLPPLGTPQVYQQNPVPIDYLLINQQVQQFTAADGFQMNVSATDDTGNLIPVDTSGALVVQQQNYITVTGTGFQPLSNVVAWLFSSPRKLGNIRVGPDGSFSARMPIGDDVPVGRHTTQVNGLTPSGEVRSVNLAVLVRDAPAVAPSPPTSFDPAMPLSVAENPASSSLSTALVVLLAVLTFGGGLLIGLARRRRRDDDLAESRSPRRR